MLKILITSKISDTKIGQLADFFCSFIVANQLVMNKIKTLD